MRELGRCMMPCCLLFVMDSRLSSRTTEARRGDVVFEDCRRPNRPRRRSIPGRNTPCLEASSARTDQQTSFVRGAQRCHLRDLMAECQRHCYAEDLRMSHFILLCRETIYPSALDSNTLIMSSRRISSQPPPFLIR